MKQLLSNVVVALLSAAFTFLLFRSSYPAPALSSEPSAPVQLVRYEAPVNAAPRNWPATPPADFVSTSRQVTDAVVNITALGGDGYPLSNGSGVIYTTDGYIITNHHVVEEGGRFEVTLSNKRRLPARVIGSDPTTDLALVKVEAPDLQPVRFGDSDRVEVGEWVLAVGNPFNLTSTITAGIVSAKARNLNIIEGSYSIESFIQTDAVVNPGNSGGALVNTAGELIGINTAIISETGRYEGYSFAIPANLVRKVVRDLRDHGRVRRAILGVGIRDVDDALAAELKLPGVSGVFVSSVATGSSAERAGLRQGDVIVGINGVDVASLPQLQEQVARYHPGDLISLDFIRQGRRYRRENVRLQGLPGESLSNR